MIEKRAENGPKPQGVAEWYIRHKHKRYPQFEYRSLGIPLNVKTMGFVVVYPMFVSVLASFALFSYF